MTPMKVLKLVYISHGMFCALNDKPLINSPVYAWKYGPVIKSVYEEFKKYGPGQIDQFADANYDGRITERDVCPDDPDLVKFLDPIWEHYKRFNGLQLSALTHQPGTPWDITMREKGEGSVIPNDLIKDYYRNNGAGRTGA